MLPLTLGHCAADLAQGAMAALVPLLADQFGLSYLQVGGILLAATVSSSLVQPLFGLWSDKASQAWVMPASVVAAGVGVSLLAWAPSYELALCCVVISGLGVAAFHPRAALRRVGLGRAALDLDGHVRGGRQRRHRARPAARGGADARLGHRGRGPARAAGPRRGVPARALAAGARARGARGPARGARGHRRRPRPLGRDGDPARRRDGARLRALRAARLPAALRGARARQLGRRTARPCSR